MKYLLLAAVLSTGLPIIDKDYGGKLYARIESMEGMVGVEIRGECYSACTLYLGLPETCVHKDAKLGFHGPKSPFGIPLPEDVFERDTRVIASYYPPKIRKWFMEKARYEIYGLKVISGRKAIRMGARPCKED